MFSDASEDFAMILYRFNAKSVVAVSILFLASGLLLRAQARPMTRKMPSKNFILNSVHQQAERIFETVLRRLLRLRSEIQFLNRYSLVTFQLSSRGLCEILAHEESYFFIFYEGEETYGITLASTSFDGFLHLSNLNKTHAIITKNSKGRKAKLFKQEVRWEVIPTHPFFKGILR